MSEEKLEVIDIRIYPSRILKPETTEKILNLIYEWDSLVRVILNGPSVPKIVGFGPAKGLPTNHSDRKKISVIDNDLELQVKVGEIIATVLVSDINDYLAILDSSLPEIIDFSYEINVGVFTKSETTTSDYIKFGTNFEKDIDSRLIGMYDPRSVSSETVKMIDRTNK